MEIAQDGSGIVAVQIEGDGNTVTVSCGGIVLDLQAKHAHRRESSDLDLLTARGPAPGPTRP